MLTIGQNFPEFELTAVVTDKQDEVFKEISNATYSGKWLVVFAWPKDFSLVCPTELVEFSRLNASFEERNAQVLGMSTDSELVHSAWKKSREDLNSVPFPMLSDIKHELANDLGILNLNAGVCNRATFIVDPKGIIRHVSVNDLKVARNIEETLRILDALQTDAPALCGWKKETVPVES